jgi:hypothetical protein
LIGVHGEPRGAPALDYPVLERPHPRDDRVVRRLYFIDA